MVNINKACTDSATIASKVYQHMKKHTATDQECPRNKKQVVWLQQQSEAPDAEVMDNTIAELLQYARHNNTDAITYIQDQILHKIVNNIKLKCTESWLGQHQCSNNNSEYDNHLLKLQVCAK